MKKIISLIICLCILASFTPAMAEDIPSLNNEAMQTLSALGIMEGIDGDLMPEKILTRAELVTLLARVMNMEYSSGKMYFEDVPADHWAQGAISAAYEQGIINGVDSTHFAPDSPVTIEQAVKMLVTALGYGGQAVRKGGYPTGYVNIAQKIDLLDKVGASNGLILRRNAAAQLFYNALHLELPLLESISSDDAEFVTRDGVTLLSENLKIKKGEGIVNANDVTTLALSGGVADGCVQIGNMVFKEGNTNASDYIGYRVTYYANIAEGNEPYELLYVTIDEDRNEVLTVLAEDILDSTTETKLCYTENNKQRTEAISIYADLLYNGVSIGGFTKTDITSAKDFVTFIDNNGDNQFDVIRVFDPKTIVVGAVNTTTFGVYDRDNATDFTLLDPDEDDYTFTIYENGVKTDFSAIKVGSVVSVGESKNISGRKNKTALISNASKEGIISAVGDNSVLIDDEEYKASSAIITTLKKYLGKSINVSIDAMGRAIRADEKAIDLFSYGYLITWGKDKGILNKILLKILTQEGEVKILNAKEKVSLDGNTAQKISDVMTLLTSTVRDGGSGVEQLIRYRQNADGEIIAIDTTASGSGGDSDKLTLSYGKGNYDGENDVRYMQNAKSFGETNPKFTVGEDTILVLVPPQEKKNNDEDYFAGDMSSLASSTYYDDIEVYDLSDTRQAKVILRESEAVLPVESSSSMVIITKISNCTSIYGEDAYKITGIQGGDTVTYITKDTSVLEKPWDDELWDGATGITKTHTDVKGSNQNLQLLYRKGDTYKKGDLVRWRLNHKNEIVNIEPLLTGIIDETVLCGFHSVGTNDGSFYATVGVSYGTLKKKDGFNILLDTVETIERNENSGWYELTSKGLDVSRVPETPYIISGNERYYVYHVLEDYLEVSSAEVLNEHLYDISSSSKVAVVTKNGAPSDIIVYKFN